MKTLKEFNLQINEVLKASDPIDKWISDFVHSKNPKFANKSKQERIEMAKGAYYGAQRNESASISQNTEVSTAMSEDHLVHVNDGSKYDDEPDEKDVEHIMAGVKQHGGEHAGASDKGVFFKFKSKEHADAFKAHANKCPNKSCDAEHVTEGYENDMVDKKKVLNPPIPLTQKKKTVKDFLKKEEVELDEAKTIDLIVKHEVKNDAPHKSDGHIMLTKSSNNKWNVLHNKKAPQNAADFHRSKVLKSYDSEKDARAHYNSLTEEEMLDEGKVYDPITKKMVARKPIKVQAGGGATRNGVPVETGPSKHKSKLPMSKAAGVLAAEEIGIDEGDNGLAAKAKKSGVSLSTLKTVYKRGVAAWNSGHRPGTTPAQWGMARVNSYITKGKGTYHGADKDLREDSRLDKTEYHKGMSAATAKARVAHWKKADKMSDSNPKAYKPAPGDKTAKTTPSVHTKKYHAMYGEAYDHGPIDRDAKVGMGHKAAVLAGSGLDSGKHGTIVGSSKERTGDMWHIKTASGDIVKMHKNRVAKLKEETEQIDEVSKSTLMRYIPKASRDVADQVATAKERQVTMAHATHAGNYDMAKKEAKKSNVSFTKAFKRLKGIDTATKKLGTQKEEVQVDEAIAKKLPVQHAVNAVTKTLGSKAATRFLGHLKPGTEKHTSWDKVNDALTKQGVQTHHIASIAQKTSHENVNESRGHKVLATFFKNREVAQRAYQGNPAKDAEVAQGGGTPADQGIAAAKKDAEKLKKEAVNPALMAILKKRQEAQKKKDEDKKKVNEAATPAVHAAEPKRTKSTSKQYVNASVPGTERVAGSKKDSNEPGEQIKEDQYTADYKIKYYVDPITGENKQRKIRPHRVNFKNSKMRGEPVQQDAQGDYGMKESHINEGGFDNYHEIAKELVKRHGKNVDSGHINDIAGERDTHRGLDHSEVMHHVNKILNKEVKEGDEYDEVWKEYKGKTFKKESRMINFKDYLKEALSAKQKKIAAIAGDKDKIDADDLAALRAGKKPVEEAKKCMDEDDMDESGLRMAAHAAHKAGKKEFEFQGKTYPVKVQKEEVEQIDEISKKTLGSYINKAAKDSRIHGQIATDFENTADKARKQSKKDSFERLNRKYLQKAWKREDGIAKAVGKLTKEDVQLDEGKMKELAMDLKDMSHDEFHKQYGKPKSHFDPSNFKKPVEPGKEMDRARALAQRGMKSVSEQLEEAATRKDFQMVADLIKGHESAEKRKELATHHAGIFKKQNSRFDHAKFMKAAGVNEEVEQEMSPYLKATLAVMDESKYDDYKDALRSKKATQSAYDKDFKPDTTHPHIQVVKGTQYGGENQKDDEGDEKPEAEKEKRGRGRPSGSKSGARLKGNGREDGGIPVHNLHLPKSYK